MKKHLLIVLTVFIIFNSMVIAAFAQQKSSNLPEEAIRAAFEDFKRFIKEEGDYELYGFKSTDEVDRAEIGDIDFIYGSDFEKLQNATSMSELLHEQRPLWQVIALVNGTPVTSLRIALNNGEYTLDGWGGEVNNFTNTKSDFKQFLRKQGAESEIKITKNGNFIILIGKTDKTEFIQVVVPGSLSYDEFKREPIESNMFLTKLKENQKKSAESLESSNPTEIKYGDSPKKMYLDLMTFEDKSNFAASPILYAIAGIIIMVSIALFIKRRALKQ